MIEVSARRHPLVQPWHLGHESDAGSHTDGIVGGVDPVDFHRAGAWHKDPRHAAERRRLAGAVAAEQDQAFARVHAHGEVPECKHVAIALGKAFNFQHG